MADVVVQDHYIFRPLLPATKWGDGRARIGSWEFTTYTSPSAQRAKELQRDKCRIQTWEYAPRARL
jgi:hypothetical protein